MEIKVLDFLYSIYWEILKENKNQADKLLYGSAASKLIQKIESYEENDDNIIDMSIIEDILYKKDIKNKLVFTNINSLKVLELYREELLREIRGINSLSYNNKISKNKQLEYILFILDSIFYNIKYKEMKK